MLMYNDMTWKSSTHTLVYAVAYMPNLRSIDFDKSLKPHILSFSLILGKKCTNSLTTLTSQVVFTGFMKT